ncbi:C40 family peptidase [Thalassobacillus sp. CUG 92003]|uniref:C40 family peptidase n=1 Tax=Thalassobacillus sp. CUG 92003 TaxID=2736641 RepID=UPI0015E6C074|nr:C40 family peptidase [Thalassobacillus sp. CUG 92003]
MFRKSLLFVLVSILSLAVFTPQAMASSTGKQIVDVARQYEGTPYEWSGESPGGFDCSGFTTYVLNKFDIDVPRSSSDQYSAGKYVSKSDLQAGDLVFFSSEPGSSSISHVGIYTSNGNYISATRSRGVDEVSINDPYYWGPRYVGAKRVVEDHSSSNGSGLYNDLSTDYWAYDEIKSMSKADIVSGYENNTFKPKASITRAEAAKMLIEAKNIKKSTKHSFGDVSGHWAEGFINAAAARGYIKGKGHGQFNPDQDISREEIAAILSRAYNMSSSNGSTFKDVNKNDWAYKHIEGLADHSITNGYDDQTFRPKNDATRAEFTVFLDRAR